MSKMITCTISCLIALQFLGTVAQSDPSHFNATNCSSADFNKFFNCMKNYNGLSANSNSGITQDDYKSEIRQCFQKSNCSDTVSFYEDNQDVAVQSDSMKQNDYKQQSCLNESFNSLKSSIEQCVRYANQAFSGFTLSQPSPLKAAGFRCSAASMFFVTSQVKKMKDCPSKDVNLCAKNVFNKCNPASVLRADKTNAANYFASRQVCEEQLNSSCFGLVSVLGSTVQNCISSKSSGDSIVDSFAMCTGDASLSLDNLLNAAIRKVDNAADTLEIQQIEQKARATMETVSNSLFGPKSPNGRPPMFLEAIMNQTNFMNFMNNISLPQLMNNLSLPQLLTNLSRGNNTLLSGLGSLNLTSPQGLGNMTKDSFNNLVGQITKSLGGTLNITNLLGQLTNGPSSQMNLNMANLNWNKK